MEHIDVPAWLQAVAAMTLIGGAVWVTIERKIEAAELRTSQRIDREAAERQRELERIDHELAGFSDVRQALATLGGDMKACLEKFNAGTALIGEKVEGLATRFADYKESADEASKSLSHGVRGLEMKFQGLAVQLAKAGTPK